MTDYPKGLEGASPVALALRQPRTLAERAERMREAADQARDDKKEAK
jgi:cob(I)alamin adenosyltransferase